MDDMIHPQADSQADTAAQQGTPRDFGADAQFFEYTAAADPVVAKIPFAIFHAREHESGATREIVWDLSGDIGTEWEATSPNLLASFLRIRAGERLHTQARATSRMFHVIRGSGETRGSFGAMRWSKGDLFALPGGERVEHSAFEDAALYTVSDAPLLCYLGVEPKESRFRPTLHSAERMLAEMRKVNNDPEARQRNRNGVLLANKAAPLTMTLTHCLWSLFNELPARVVQKPHRHNSVALDLCVAAAPGTYTLIGEQLDAQGGIVNPVRRDWVPGSAFVTPPGLWHSHHNETDVPAIVLPVQDAGLHTWMRTLDIRFA